jgi:hypothetical protein
MEHVIALAAFAARYRLDPAALTARIAASGYDDAVEILNPAADGHVERLRIKPLGRFGNVFAQVLHAMMVARALGVRRIAFPGYQPGPAAGEAAGIRLEASAGPDGRPDGIPHGGPTLAANFFWAAPFGRILTEAPDAEAMLAALAWRYAHLMPPAPAEEIAVHFRAGDVFGVQSPGGYDWIVPIYVQPPASYYQAAIAGARAETGIGPVRLVYEGTENPAVSAVAEWLLRERIPFTAQSRTAAEDLRALIAARVMVGGCGTFAEAAALLSPHLRTLWAFRTVECHAHIQARREPLWARLLASKAVAVRVLADEGDYIPPLTWANSAEQHRLIREYQAEKISLLG